MTPDRFRTIVDAYGADARHWPAGERAAALAWAETHRDEAHALLLASAQLDAWLATDAPPQPDAALTRRIIASAPVPPRARAPRARVWWSGAAFIGAGLAGALAGAFVVSFVLLAGSAPLRTTPGATLDAPSLATGFDGTTSDWSGE
ncbi:hypothetical protein [Paraburkholderia sp. SOS3]|jgi:hypothetical protein|uniref:hypothetical protein n=1 Tax=Paraburkholderia sp. SOS3 TaxID=1926494 RepID=UPI0009477BE0|nr:hypothetical protein [Paraburkholderia sp. SOS3]APR35175.1 hypothetical protein BTO02_06750 [Paraburkholderia sp. SOS3]